MADGDAEGNPTDASPTASEPGRGRFVALTPVGPRRDFSGPDTSLVGIVAALMAAVIGLLLAVVLTVRDIECGDEGMAVAGGLLAAVAWVTAVVQLVRHVRQGVLGRGWPVALLVLVIASVALVLLPFTYADAGDACVY